MHVDFFYHLWLLHRFFDSKPLILQTQWQMVQRGMGGTGILGIGWKCGSTAGSTRSFCSISGGSILSQVACFWKIYLIERKRCMDLSDWPNSDICSREADGMCHFLCALFWVLGSLFNIRRACFAQNTYSAVFVTSCRSAAIMSGNIHNGGGLRGIEMVPRASADCNGKSVQQCKEEPEKWTRAVEWWI